MSFKRWLTSVLCSCILLSSILVVPASAVDDDDYYSAPVLSDGSVSAPSLAVDWPVSPASATSWDTVDRSVLQGIYKFIQYMTTAPSSYSDNSVIGLLHRILNKSGSSGSVPNADTNFRLIGGDGTNDFLNNIYRYVSGDNISGNLGNIQRNTLASSDRLLSVVSSLGALYDHVASESTLSAFASVFTGRNYSTSYSYVPFSYFLDFVFGGRKDGSGHYAYPVWRGSSADDSTVFYDSWSSVVGNLSSTFSSRYNPNNPDGHTIFYFLSMLQEVLATEEDKALRDSQKENVDQVKKDFVTGSSGKTSLGKDDFGSLSSVGGTFKDISSLNGQASLDSFSSGLTDADTAGQGWFSQSTKDALDSVSGSTTSESTVSTFSDDGLFSVDVDPDPYNMGNFEDNYSWLWGEK